mmetsp:Transcript_11378/g.26731  ORF Transcript_11378/g.26731 Transcript_11378/m.26731 type:complete len:169 (+) Transcript_11378:1092-1598(+)
MGRAEASEAAAARILEEGDYPRATKAFELTARLFKTIGQECRTEVKAMAKGGLAIGGGGTLRAAHITSTESSLGALGRPASAADKSRRARERRTGLEEKARRAEAAARVATKMARHCRNLAGILNEEDMNAAEHETLEGVICAAGTSSGEPSSEPILLRRKAIAWGNK